MKEHLSSPYPFGKALRKYKRENFKYYFIQCNDLDDALRIEKNLVGLKEVKSKKYYNISPGGRPDVQIGLKNPMHDSEVVKRHPNIWTTENNPMNDPKLKEKNKLSQSKFKKFVYAYGSVYKGIRNTAKIFGMSSQKFRHRCKSKNYPDVFFM